ncbi:MAG: N-acetyl-gamma-glutamyl-phosphate reductase [Candidatus Bathyarchaeia archaeon]
MIVGVLGASGYAGGELLRILLFHPEAEVRYTASKEFPGMPVHMVHPNLRKVTDLKFEKTDMARCSGCDVVFLALPHTVSLDFVPQILEMGVKVIDLSADYRLKDPKQYETYYGTRHRHPELLERAVYGLPELHREEIRGADLVACPGCNSTAVILALAPILKNFDVDQIVSDIKVASSASGSRPTLASHHAERSGVVRPYKLAGHRHQPEVEQELTLVARRKVSVPMSLHAVDLVRGLLSTNYVFLKEELDEKEVWRAFRSSYGAEPFVRVFRTKRGTYRLADPKVIVGTNYCDISFELSAGRLIVVSAIDNLVKGAAGQAVQDWNLTMGIDERTGLRFPGLHPI